jgi:hypothetical protein
MFLRIIPVIEGQFFPGVNISQGYNPDSSSGKFCDTVRITGMIDVASGVAEYLAVNIILPIKGKDIDIALVYALGTFLFGNPLPNILENPGVFFDVLSRKHAFACNLGLPNPYPYFHGSASSLHSLYPLSPPRNSQYEEMYQGRQEAVGDGAGLRLTKNSFKFQNLVVLKQTHQFSPKLVMEDFLLLGRDSVLPAYGGAKAPLCNPPLFYTHPVLARCR